MLCVSVVHPVVVVVVCHDHGSVFKSVKASVVEIAKRKRIDLTGFRHRSSGDKSVGCVVQANRCLTSCVPSPIFDLFEAPQSVQMSLGSPNTLCL